MPFDSSGKTGVDHTPSEMVDVEADAKRSMPPGIVKVEDQGDVKSVVDEPLLSLKAVESEMNEQNQPLESTRSGPVLDGGTKKKSLASRARESVK
jgi:hypothetical protein